MTKRNKFVVGATVSLVVGAGCMAVGYGPLAYEPTIVLSFVVQLFGGALAAFGVGLALSGESIKRAALIGLCGTLGIAAMVGVRVMSNANRASRILSFFGSEHPAQEMHLVQ